MSPLAEHSELVAASPLFDASWYLQTYPDVALGGHDPLQHFLTLGWRIGRSPSAAFDCGLYLQANKDVAAAGMNPLLHYLLYGQQEGRSLVPKTKPVIRPQALTEFVQQALENQPAPPAAPQGLEERLRQTQQQLEHYFLRCQELEYQVRQLKTD